MKKILNLKKILLTSSMLVIPAVVVSACFQKNDISTWGSTQGKEITKVVVEETKQKLLKYPNYLWIDSDQTDFVMKGWKQIDNKLDINSGNNNVIFPNLDWKSNQPLKPTFKKGFTCTLEQIYNPAKPERNFTFTIQANL